MRALSAALLLGLLAGVSLPASAQELRPPSAVRAADNPDDNGHGILLTWTLSPDDSRLMAYEIQRSADPAAPDADWAIAGTAPRGTASFLQSDENPSLQGNPNPSFVPTGTTLHYRVRAVAPDGAVSEWTPPAGAAARGNWFHFGRTNVLMVVLLFGGANLFFISAARKGRELYVRRLPGIDAVDEAIGRATEMGKPILYVLGTGTAGDIGTIAGCTILARVARRTAEYQTEVMVPVNDPVLMAVAQETVREAYLESGRPDLYRSESVFYISAMQFPYVAAVNGLMMRERPATNFYMGVFHAESLLLAEAGSVTGSIQISGTDQLAQIPFFVAATDYTLIGEELYAASAYLSKDPAQLGPLKAQDWSKMAILAIILLGVVTLSAFGWDGISRLVHAV